MDESRAYEKLARKKIKEHHQVPPALEDTELRRGWSQHSKWHCFHK